MRVLSGQHRAATGRHRRVPITQSYFYRPKPPGTTMSRPQGYAYWGNYAADAPVKEGDVTTGAEPGYHGEPGALPGYVQDAVVKGAFGGGIKNVGGALAMGADIATAVPYGITGLGLGGLRGFADSFFGLGQSVPGKIGKGIGGLLGGYAVPVFGNVLGNIFGGFAGERLVADPLDMRSHEALRDAIEAVTADPLSETAMGAAFAQDPMGFVRSDQGSKVLNDIIASPDTTPEQKSVASDAMHMIGAPFAEGLDVGLSRAMQDPLAQGKPVEHPSWAQEFAAAHPLSAWHKTHPAFGGFSSAGFQSHAQALGELGAFSAGYLDPSVSPGFSPLSHDPGIGGGGDFGGDLGGGYEGPNQGPGSSGGIGPW